MKNVVYAADHYCGAGGTSSGLVDACKEIGRKVDLVAVNHWPLAIQSHQANHPWARHYCMSIKDVDPRRAVPDGRLDIMVASPSCTYYSRARGGKPVRDQQRSDPKDILRWLDEVDVRNFMIENVPEFTEWGPLHNSGHREGRPIKSRKGEYYKRFVRAIERRGYTVEPRVLNAADYGDATTRRRLFILGRKGRRDIAWPEPSHVGRWRPAREILDRSIPGESIFSRPKPLRPTTIARIIAGLRKYGPPEIQEYLSFLVMFYGTNDARSLDRPLPTVTANGTHIGLCEFILGHRQFKEEVVDSVDRPFRTITAKSSDMKLVQAMLRFPEEHEKAAIAGNGDKKGNGRANGNGHANGSGVPGVKALDPFIVPFFGEREGQPPRSHSVDAPLPAVTSHGAGGLVQSFLIPVNHGKGDVRSHSLDEPMPTITGVDAWAKIEAYLVKYFGTATARPISEPLDTITTKDRYALVEPKVEKAKDHPGYVLDIRFRMLTPKELARAMSFDDGYLFAGSRSDQVKQIGNAVPRRLAKALTKSLLVGY